MLLDIAPSEFLLTAVIAIVVIGPKDLPRALRTAGRWMGKMRRVSGHLRSGIETMIREAELEEMEQKWREQNAAIMREHPVTDATAAHGMAEPETPEHGASGHETLGQSALTGEAQAAAPAAVPAAAVEPAPASHLPSAP